MKKRLASIVIACVMVVFAPAEPAHAQCTADCEEGKNCGFVAIRNIDCKRGLWPWEENKVRVHVYVPAVADEICTDKWIDLDVGGAETVELKGCYTVAIINEQDTCIYRHEAEGTAASNPDLDGRINNSVVNCKRDWAGVCQCELE